ncbi:hypothetical protein GOV12_06190 [Candidatus Pacearchaeota archaeon]|nr:hypothetical protein [Candidatus Pacearchaeota archaeon]
MDRFQKNTVKSFRRVKDDIRNLQAQITEVMRMQEDLMEKSTSSEVKNKRPVKVVKKVVKKKK